MKSMFRSSLNESLAHHTDARTTTYPNLSIVTSSIFGEDGLVPVPILTIIKSLHIHTPYIRIVTMKTVTYGYNQSCSVCSVYDLVTYSTYGSLPP